MNKKGFTLVELLAVIAILAILVLIALPNIVNMFTDAKKRTFVTEAQTVYNETVKKYINSSMKGEKLTTISSKDSSKLDMTGEDLDYCIILDSQGKVEKLAVGNNSHYLMLKDIDNVNSITKEKVQEGKLNDMKCDASAFKVKLDCKFDGNLKQGAEYVNGQYTYRYMQKGTFPSASENNWQNTNEDGWGVVLTDKNSTDPVTTDLCSTINNKPIVSMSSAFYNSKASSIDLSSFDTGKVTDMNSMFFNTEATSLDLKSFDTKNVGSMSRMFCNSKALSLDLSSFDTSNVTSIGSMFSSSKASVLDLRSFDTSKAIYMESMFSYSAATEIKGLEKFNTSNVTNMGSMFSGSKALALNLS